MLERAAILSTGDEITSGKVIDTNANYIANKMVEAGLEVASVITVGDVKSRIVWAWKAAMTQADVIISTGGIGPTADDLTTELVAEVAGVDLIFSEEVAANIRRIFASLNRPMPENNLKQAEFPKGASIIPNHLGTAPGYRVALKTPTGPKHLIVLPGVPREMKPMMNDSVIPWIEEVQGGGHVFLTNTFQTFGISESGLDELVSGTISEEEGKVAFRASFPQISVRVTVRGTADEVAHKIEILAERLRKKIGPYLYGEGDTRMEDVVGDLFSKQGKTVSVADACTGGLLSHRLTNVSGSSNYFRGSLVPHFDEPQQRLLGLKPDTIARHGQVSEEAAKEMAEGIRKLMQTDIGLAVIGITGPEEVKEGKRTGTTCLALCTEDGVASREYNLWRDLEWVKIIASQLSLDWLRRALLQMPIVESGFMRK